jgi:hypothetical protein
MRPQAWNTVPAIQAAAASWRVPRWRRPSSSATARRNADSLPAGTPNTSRIPDARRTRARAAPPVSVTGSWPAGCAATAVSMA